MQILGQFLMNSLYGDQIRKDIIESYKRKSEHWMQKEYGDNVLDYLKLPNENNVV